MDQMDMVKTAVGEGAAAEWSAWVLDADLPSPESMLNNGWEPDTLRLDRSLAAYTSAAVYVTAQKDRATQKELAVKAWRLFEQACTAGMADIIVPPAQCFVNNNLGISAGPEMAQAAKNVMSQLGWYGLARMACEAK